MNDWTLGYRADIDYTFGYYPELNPLRTRLVFLKSGLMPPAFGAHCELGFGQGLSVNIHAAAAGQTWHGCDFNPVQAGFAQSLAKASGASAYLTDQAFADFCTRADLPDFDSIGLHGIWSWINDENRKAIVDFVRRKLKVGGVLYISYNTQPGWAPIVPIRDLLTEHSALMGAAGQGISARIEGALSFADRLLATNPRFMQANPHIAERFAKIKGMGRNYLAHEYFNRDWLPMPFTSMSRWLGEAKLDFACSALYMDHVDVLNLSGEQSAFLKEIPDRTFRETVRDFMVNQSFRRDYWVKGARQLNPLERVEGLRALRFVMVQPRADVTLKVTGVLGEATMQAEVYNPILDNLADHQPRSIGEIERAVRDKGISLVQLIEALLVLEGAGHVAAAQDAMTSAMNKPQTDRLNAMLIDKARGSEGVQFLASPVTGGGIVVPRFDQLFLAAIAQGVKQPSEWVLMVRRLLQAQGQTLVKEGKNLGTEEEIMKELVQYSERFQATRLPTLRALLVA